MHLKEAEFKQIIALIFFADLFEMDGKCFEIILFWLKWKVMEE